MKTVLFALLCLTGSAFSSPVSEQAHSLGKRLKGTVQHMILEPFWAPDESALFIKTGSEIIRVGTESGEATSVAAMVALKNYFETGTPKIWRFSIDESGDMICLVTVKDKPFTVHITENGVRSIGPKDDPFSLLPRKVDHKTRSKNNGAPTHLFFVNNTDRTVDIEWVDASKTRKTYSTLQPGQTYSQHTYSGHVFIAGGLAFTATANPSVAYLATEPGSISPPPQSNPWKAEFRENNLYVKKRGTDLDIQLTSDGSKDAFYSAPVHWSPCKRYLLAMREKPGTNRHIDLMGFSQDTPFQSKTLTIPYAKPGDELNVQKPHLFNLKTGKEIPIEDSLFTNPWSLSRFHWSSDGERLFFLYNERGHQTIRLLEVKTATGNVTSILEETSPTFIDYSQKTFLQHLEETDEAIWMSERSGWNHLYLINRNTGKAQAITSGEWVVRGVDHVDTEKRQIWFRALGIYPDQDPYHVHYARINFDGTGLIRLTQSNGTHHLQYSPKRTFYIDTWSRVDQPPVHELHRSSDGRKIADLGKADATELLQLHPHLPEPFSAKGRDGKTDIYGVIYRPTHFDPDKSYPVIETIYAGPHGQFVPKNFTPFRNPQRMAELGFIVVQIDGMGTNWRSKSFHNVCWKNLKDAGFPDRIAWLKAAAATYPYMDMSRIGIYGGSAGGQNAMRAVLDHADFYKAAAADCGCHDNRMDKIWWNEAWMGWPVDESYEKSSNWVDAHKLGGQLLLTVGMMDRNVDPYSTLQVVEALIKANKSFEFIPFPSAGHGAGASEYGQQRREEFFIRHLDP